MFDQSNAVVYYVGMRTEALNLETACRLLGYPANRPNPERPSLERAIRYLFRFWDIPDMEEFRRTNSAEAIVKFARRYRRKRIAERAGLYHVPSHRRIRG